MLENIEHLYHSTVKISKGKVIYIDPFKIEQNYNDADYIFITHNHFDHYSEEDIKKVIKENTTIIVPEDLKEEVLKLGIAKEKTITVKPNQNYEIESIKFETIPAYNVNKSFHKKEYGWVGYIITIENTRYYISGDTDENKDNIKVKCDVAFVPIGGTYTMNAKEAAEFINKIKPKIAIPIHYGTIVGNAEDAREFINRINSPIKGIIQ